MLFAPLPPQVGRGFLFFILRVVFLICINLDKPIVMIAESGKSPRQKMNRSKIVSRIAGTGVILFNSFVLLPGEIYWIGWQLFENRFVVFTLLWLIPAVATWASKNKTDFYLCLLNSFGLAWSLFVWFLLYVSPKIG